MFTISINTERPRLLAAAIVLLATAAAVSAQAPASRPAETSPRPAARSSSQPAVDSAGLFESNTLLQMLDRSFNTETDSFDPEEGTFSWKGRTFQLQNTRLFKSRFERYLDMPPSVAEENQRYQDLLDDIFDRLSTRRRSNPENVETAWQMLFDAGEYDADGGSSLVVANLVFNAWRVRDEYRSGQLGRSDMERDRRYAEAIVTNRGRLLQQLQDERRRIQGDEAGDGSLGSDIDFRRRDLAEIEAKIKALEAQGALTGQQAKLQFQSQIIGFLLQRRFQHALISSAFYRIIFRGTAQTLEVGQSEMEAFFPDTELVPSIESIEFLAREAIADVGAGMGAVENAFAEGRLINALQRLQESFFLGEHLQPVQRFDYAKRQTLLDVYRRMEETRKLADLRDYDAVEESALELRELARDFRGSEVFSAVRSIKRVSNLSLFSARQALSTGDMDRAEAALSRASAAWPLNPALEDFTDQIASQVDVSTQAVRFFDEAYERGDYRRIFDRRNEVAPGLYRDPERSELLKEVIDKIARIDMLLAQSKEMVAQNNPYAAWEMLALAGRIDSNDVALNREKATLAPRVAAFVGVLEAAGREESEGRHAVSLSRYLEVRELYPASQLARQGIERVGRLLMDELAGEQANGLN